MEMRYLRKMEEEDKQRQIMKYSDQIESTCFCYQRTQRTK